MTKNLTVALCEGVSGTARKVETQVRVVYVLRR